MTTTLTSIINSPCPEALRGLAGTFLVPLFRARVPTACMYACMHACMHVCMRVCMYACVYACMHACMHVCMRVCIYACVYACMHACMHVCMHVCMYACMYVCMHVCEHVLMYTCMHIPAASPGIFQAFARTRSISACTGGRVNVHGGGSRHGGGLCCSLRVCASAAGAYQGACACQSSKQATRAQSAQKPHP